MVLVVSAIFASAFMMVTVYLHLYRLHPHVHRNYNRGYAMSTGLAGFIAPDFDASAPFIYVGNYFIVTVSYGVTLKNAFHSTFTFNDAGCSGYKKRIHPHQSSFIFSVNRDFLAEWIRCFLGTWRMSETTFQAITRLAGFVRPVPESEPRPAVRLVPAGWRASAVG